MNRNIFLNKHNQQNFKYNHTAVNTINNVQEEPNNKFNPDVINNFTSKNSSLKLKDIEYTNQIWKGITGDEFKMNVKESNDLKIEFEKPNINEIMTKHNNELSNRMKDKEMIDEKNRLIKQAALQNIMQLEIIPETNTIISESKMYDELKHIQIKDNDILKDEKEKFNLLLRGLEDIL